jgi:exosortase
MTMLPLLLKLVLLASGWILIWLKYSGSLADASAALVAMAALPLAIWLGMPWQLHKQSRTVSRLWSALAGVALIAGWFLHQALLLSCGWMVFTGILLAQHLTAAAWRQRIGLLPLGLLSLPWLGEDASWLSNLFRSSGAWVAERCFGLLGFDVVRAGTRLMVEGQEISVEPACAGMNSLHATLVAGAVFGWLRMREDRRKLTLWLVALPAIAWLTNTLRIIIISVLGLHTSPEMVAGTAHEMIGWMLVLIVFGLSSTALEWLPQKRTHTCL